MTSLEGVIYNLSNQGTYGAKVRFHQGCRKRVQDAESLGSLRLEIGSQNRQIRGTRPKRANGIYFFSKKNKIKLSHLSFVDSK